MRHHSILWELLETWLLLRESSHLLRKSLLLKLNLEIL